MYGNVIIHTGAKGQKWGVRNYRNYDGTLTDEGRQRYDYYENKTDRVYKTARIKQLGEKTYHKTNRWGVLAEDLSKYTNDELRALTERAKIESEYRNAFNTTQYTKGKRILEGFKTFGKEASSVASIGKSLIENVNGIKKALRDAEKAAEKAKQDAVKDAENKARRIQQEHNEKEVKDFILSVDASKRKHLVDLLNTISKTSGGKKGKGGGSNWGTITPEMLKKIKGMSKY